PLFGVAVGHLVLNEPLTPAFAAAVGLVAIGLVLGYRARWRRLLYQAGAITTAVGDARLLEIQLVLDPASGFVGDLTVAQELIDEIALGIDEFFLERGALACVVETISQIAWQDLSAALIA